MGKVDESCFVHAMQADFNVDTCPNMRVEIEREEECEERYIIREVTKTRTT